MRYSDTPAERAFLNAAPCFHLYTTPLESDFFFHDDHERVIALNLMAIVKTASDCKLLAYSIMTNHFLRIRYGHYTADAALAQEMRTRQAALLARIADSTGAQKPTDNQQEGGEPS